MNRHEQKTLLSELLGGSEIDEFRQDTLQRGLIALRWRKRRRVGAQIAAVVGLPLALGIAVVLYNDQPLRSRSSPSLQAAATPNQPAAALAPRLKTITDDELFALFPGRPMALVGKPGQQELIFLDQPVSRAPNKSQ